MEEKQQRTDIADTIRTFIGILEKRKWYAIGMLVATVSVSLLVTAKQTPVYRATATVIIERRSPAVLGRVQEVIELGAGDYWSIKEYMETQYEILRSRRLAKRVVDKLSLSLDEKFLGLDRTALAPEQKRERMAKLDAVALLMGKVRVEPKVDSQMVLVSVEDPDPVMAQELANAMVTEYKEENLEYRKRVMTEALSELQAMEARLQKDKEEAEERVQEFERQYSIGSLKSRKEQVTERLKILNEKYVQARLSRIDKETSPGRAQLAAQVAELTALLASGDVTKSSYPKLVVSAAIQGLKQKLVELEEKVREVEAKYGPKMLSMQAAYSQRALVRAALQREARALLEAELTELTRELNKENDALKKDIQYEDELRRELEQAKEEEAALVKLELDYGPLVERKDEALALYENVKKRFSEASLSAQVETNNVRVQDLAAAPKKPVRPDKRLNLLIGILVGLLLGIGAAFFVESLDSTIKTREDIELVGGVEFLGLVPAVEGLEGAEVEPSPDRTELVVVAYPKSTVAEHFRTVKTNLFFSRLGARPKRILITSPGPKEGKTTVGANLAAVAAMAGSRTLLIDTDMRRPRVHKLMQIPRRPGMTEFFLGARPIESFVRRSAVEGFDVLTCGSLSPNPVEILESKKFREAMDELAGKYDTVIFDSPPLLAVADAKILCSKVDAVVLVCRAGQTSKDALKEARRTLYPAVSNDIGVVLNCFDVEKHSYRYYYYRSKRYRYYNYYAYDEKPAAEPETGASGATGATDDGAGERSQWGRQSG